MENPIGYFFFGNENCLDPFYGVIKEPIKFFKSLNSKEIRRHFKLISKDIEKLSLYDLLRGKIKEAIDTKMVSRNYSKSIFSFKVFIFQQFRYPDKLVEKFNF